MILNIFVDTVQFLIFLDTFGYVTAAESTLYYITYSFWIFLDIFGYGPNVRIVERTHENTRTWISFLRLFQKSVET